MTQIASLFQNDINRRIEEVIKVDQTDEDIVALEIDEYVVTDAIKRHFLDVLERYQDMPQRPNDGIAVWVSGFFGSGKSSFAKVLGLSIENRCVAGENAADRFSSRTGDHKLAVVLKTINEKIPTHTVIFDVSTDRGIRSGNQMLTQIMYRLFLGSLGYAEDLDLSELEIGLEERGELDIFKGAYRTENNKDWDTGKRRPMFALGETSKTLNGLWPETFPTPQFWAETSRNRTDITAGKLAERFVELMGRRKPGQSLMFVIDEVGQFVARDVQKMLDLQAVVQQLGVKGRGKHWVVVTSQEKLNELVSGLENSKIELARLMDRFPTQVHLEPSDISEVTGRRVLRKNAAAEGLLGKLFESHRGRLIQYTRLAADVALPNLNRQSFVDLYPLLPYQIDLIIQIVSGLRTQSGASKHVGGANRTIIKLAQQLLIAPSTRVADDEVGSLVRLDQIYDLVEGNISSEVREKISSIPAKVDHPLAPRVAKTICLLQFARTVHRTAENIASALHDRIDAESCLTLVREALGALEKALLVRKGDDGYRIPTPAEDDWDNTRSGFDPRTADRNRLLAEVLSGFWAPIPTFSLADTKQFKAGLMVGGKEEVSGDITFNVQVAEDAGTAQKLAEEVRKRSQVEPKSIFWVVTVDGEIERELREAFRSQQMIEKKQRDTTSADSTALVAEEKVRQRRHMDELRRRLRAACLTGQVYFQGNDRSPDSSVVDVGKTAASILGQVLPTVYDRFSEAAAKATDLKKGLDALFVAENLNGLPSVFLTLGLLRDEKGKPVFKTDVTPLSEILGQIEARASYGEQATGKYLEDQFAKVPFGWDFEAVRLLTLCLLRAGAIEAVSKSVTIDSATSTQAKECFSSNNLFRATNLRPKKGVDMMVIVQAAEHFKMAFGSEVKELSAGAITAEIRREVDRHEDDLVRMLTTLRGADLPGTGVIENATDQMKAIRRGSEDNAISTFNAGYKSIQDAIRRTVDLSKVLTEPVLKDLSRAKGVLAQEAAVLADEPEVDPAIADKATRMKDDLAKETFFREIPAIEQAATAIAAEYKNRYQAALDARVQANLEALLTLRQTPGWERLDEAQKTEVSKALLQGSDRSWNNQTIRHLRSETEACQGRLATAIQNVHRILEGARLATVSVNQFFSGGIENEDQLDQALSGIREEFSRLLGAGKKVIVK